MAMDVLVTGSNLDSNGNIKVTLPNAPQYTGVVRSMSENDPGSIVGTPVLKSPEVSQDYRIRTGVDTVMFSDIFNATAQNISLYKHAFGTMTMTQSSGFLNVNAAGTSTASGNFASLQTWRYFPLIGTSPLAVEIVGQVDRVPVANEVFLCGLGVANGAAEPLDGIWFEYTDAGLKGCTRFNSGTVNKTPAMLTTAQLPLNISKTFSIVVGYNVIEFWIDNVLYGTLNKDAAAGVPFISGSLPWFCVKYNNGLIGTSPNMKIQIAALYVTLMDIGTNMTWAGQMASNGLTLQQLNGGSATSPQIQWANTALPTAAAATNTTAALGAFIGGIFQQNAAATSATDVIIASYQNPLGGVAQTARTLKLRGIKIDCVNLGAAVATTATTMAVALAWGGSSVTLAATESTSFQTGTTKLRRIQPLGVVTFAVGAAIGAVANPIQFDFEAPIVINPGEYVQVIAKILVGTATASEVFCWVISPNAYHE